VTDHEQDDDRESGEPFADVADTPRPRRGTVGWIQSRFTTNPRGGDARVNQ
jgi:hypothetical protein